MLMNNIQKDFTPKFLNRVIVAAILILIAIPSIIFGGWLLIAVVLVALALAMNEILNVRQGVPYPLAIKLFVYIIAILLVFWVFIDNNFALFQFDFSQWTFYQSMNKLSLSTVLLTIMVATLFFSSITDVRFKVQDATYLITLTTILSLSFQAFLHLRYFPSFYDGEILAPARDGFHASTLLIYVAIGTFATDIGAYMVGTFFGKFKMNPRVSKNKTWEGFWGGVIISALTSFSFAWISEALGTPILPFLTLSYWYILLIFSIMIPLVATLGDFTFSIIKREFGVKNFSSILGEHGGILDRVDSFSMTCLASSLFITIIYDWMVALSNLIS